MSRLKRCHVKKNFLKINFLIHDVPELVSESVEAKSSLKYYYSNSLTHDDVPKHFIGFQLNYIRDGDCKTSKLFWIKPDSRRLQLMHVLEYENNELVQKNLRIPSSL